MSTTRNVSIIGSMTSSGILTSLLFWMLSVSNEFKFSKAIAGKLLMLRDERGKIVENYKNSFSLTRENGSKQIYVISMQNALFVHSLFEPTSRAPIRARGQGEKLQFNFVLQICLLIPSNLRNACSRRKPEGRKEFL